MLWLKGGLGFLSAACQNQAWRVLQKNPTLLEQPLNFFFEGKHLFNIVETKIKHHNHSLLVLFKI